MKYLKNIRTLNLWNCQNITDNGLKYLNNVRELNISCCYNITGNGFKFLKKIHTLISSACDNLEDNSLQYLSNIHTLDISDCPNITGEGFKYLKKIHTLDISLCDRIIYENLLKFDYKVNIHTLKLMKNNISDNDLTIIQYFLNIKKLNITGCRNITSNTIKELKKCCIVHY